ncbi:MAG: hypothetical protein SOZ78_05750 [Eubacteriales bacterium]|nr:hypothetical protein [Eubacteriales bacterium]
MRYLHPAAAAICIDGCRISELCRYKLSKPTELLPVVHQSKFHF